MINVEVFDSVATFWPFWNIWDSIQMSIAFIGLSVPNRSLQVAMLPTEEMAKIKPRIPMAFSIFHGVCSSMRYYEESLEKCKK